MNVKFLGRLEDVRALYAASNLIVIPSRQEGQGIVALEALAAGRAVVAAAVGGLGETLKDQETALLFPVEDVTAMRRAIEQLLMDSELRKRLADNGRALVEHEYQDEAMAEKTMAFYQSLIKRE